MNQTETEHLRGLRAAIDAKLAGKRWQFRHSGGRKWITADSDSVIGRTDGYDFRAASEPVTRPWSKPEDVPGPACWFRGVHTHPERHPDYREQLIIGFSNQTAFITASCGCEPVVMSTLFSACDWTHMEHSTDRKHWSPCTITEEQP